MRDAKENKCEVHNLPFIKIETNSKRLLCEKCINENEEQRRQRLELQRLKLNKAYLIRELNDLKQVKKQTDKLVELFQSKNMGEAKKIINKSSPEVQKIVEAVIEREVKEANKILKEKAEQLLEPWKGVDGRSFSTLYLQFEQEQQKIESKLNELKQVLRQQIANKLKQEVRAFYCNLYEF